MLSLSFNEAARRGTWTCLSCSTLSPSSQGLMTALSRPLIGRSHQRKHSSSKPPSPPKNIPRNIPRAIDTPSKVLSKGSGSTIKQAVEKRTSTRPSRRKTKDITPVALAQAKDEALLSIPSVPSTQHLHPQDLHMASFFSIHRPISVTASVPPPSTSNAFSSIFAPTTHAKHEPSQVMYTISSAVNSLESSAASPAEKFQQMASEGTNLHSAISQVSYNDNPTDVERFDPDQPEVIHLNIQELVKNFRPFLPPPPPVAMDVAEKRSRQASRKRVPKQKSFSAVLTIVERTDINGRKTYETSACSIREDPPLIVTKEAPAIESPPCVRQPFLNYMRERQRRWEEFQREKGGKVVWYMISVKRQRKLKMKKHKYKKLMRRTRTLRRKLNKS